MPNADLYDRDFHAWATEQAALLRAGALSSADIEHIAEEIESMGRTDKRELISRLTVARAFAEMGVPAEPSRQFLARDDQGPAS
jgi:hypothetical protein